MKLCLGVLIIIIKKDMKELFINIEISIKFLFIDKFNKIENYHH